MRSEARKHAVVSAAGAVESEPLPACSFPSSAARAATDFATFVSVRLATV